MRVKRYQVSWRREIAFAVILTSTPNEEERWGTFVASKCYDNLIRVFDPEGDGDYYVHKTDGCGCETFCKHGDCCHATVAKLLAEGMFGEEVLL